MTSRGMMAENMFNGKAVILGWLNTSFDLRLEKIEDTCNGAIACQIMDYLHPGSVNMKRVDFNVKNAYEYVGNYKELQQAFNRLGVDRAFNVAALSKGKMQDNNEFMQWFKGYWDDRTGGQDMEEYDAVGRRCVAKTGDWKAWSAAADTGGAAAVPGGGIPAIRRAVAPAPRASRAAPAPGAAAARAASKEPLAPAAPRISRAELEELTARLETAERERDFYFDKLRDIEILSQLPVCALDASIKLVERILYAADGAEAKAVLAEAQGEEGEAADGEEVDALADPSDLLSLADPMESLTLDAPETTALQA